MTVTGQGLRLRLANGYRLARFEAGLRKAARDVKRLKDTETLIRERAKREITSANAAAEGLAKQLEHTKTLLRAERVKSSKLRTRVSVSSSQAIVINDLARVARWEESHSKQSVCLWRCHHYRRYGRR